MRISHRISLSCTETDCELLRGCNINATLGFFSFEVFEDSPEWSVLSNWIHHREPVDIVETRFTPEEIQTASWLLLEPSYHWGYPQPEDDDEYIKRILEYSSNCKTCGVICDPVQVRPFSMAREPTWGKNSIMQLNWVFDEYFVKPEIYQSTFKSFGVEFEFVHGKHGNKLSTVLQLRSNEYVPINTDSLVFSKCPTCGQEKAAAVVRGFFPSLRAPSKGHMAKTTVSFGDSGSAFRGVIVSGELGRALMKNKVKGVSYRPLTG